MKEASTDRADNSRESPRLFLGLIGIRFLRSPAPNHHSATPIPAFQAVGFGLLPFQSIATAAKSFARNSLPGRDVGGSEEILKKPPIYP
jgi:hypothetical protein